MNIVTSWKKRAARKHETVAAGLRFANMVCGLKMTQSNLNDIEKGRRKLPESLQRFMMNEVLLGELADAGFSISTGSFEQLRDALSVPNRVK